MHTSITRVAAWQLPDQTNTRANTQRLIEHATLAHARGAELVCFSECFLQGYQLNKAHVQTSALTTSSSTFTTILEASKALDLYIVFGFIERTHNAIYNSCAIIKSGHLLGTYQKQHLLRREEDIFSAGTISTNYGTEAFKFGINICNDLNHMDPFHKQHTNLLVCPCNNMLERNIAQRWQSKHHKIRQQLAQDLNCWILSADIASESNGDPVSYGPTSLIAPNGTIIDRVPQCESGMVFVDLQNHH